MIYLASPYTHPDPAVRVKRFRNACEMTAEIQIAEALDIPVCFQPHLRDGRSP